jgi:undecaprenyl-diphosphatase
MFEQIILGIIQGITEWFPLSSEGMIVLAKIKLFHHEPQLELFVKEALFLHLGTFFAALIFFRREVALLMRTLVRYPSASPEAKRLFQFLFLSTFLSGGLGFILMKLSANLLDQIGMATKWFTLSVGALLLITGGLLLKAKHVGDRKMGQVSLFDSILLGIVQGLATLPGLSRSGLTVSALLLRHFDKTQALKISFLMSLPIIAAGNLLLNAPEMHFSLAALMGVVFSFIFGIGTINLLFKIVPKINFGYFVLFFGTLVIISTLF